VWRLTIGAHLLSQNKRDAILSAVGAHCQSQIVWHHTVCAHRLSQINVTL